LLREVLFALFVVVFLSVICWALMLLMPGRAAQEELQMEASLKSLYNQTVVAVKDDNFDNVPGGLRAGELALRVHWCDAVGPWLRGCRVRRRDCAAARVSCFAH